jgi:hypothetical protein
MLPGGLLEQKPASIVLDFARPAPPSHNFTVATLPPGITLLPESPRSLSQGVLRVAEGSQVLVNRRVLAFIFLYRFSGFSKLSNSNFACAGDDQGLE